ncbi:MAG: CBU_0592 family membrane protein [Steroidobacteraceae bacterium]
MNGSSLLIEIVGWLGAAILIAAYGFVSYGLVDARSRAYQALNLVSGLLLAANSVWHRAWPSAAVNIIWAGIAVGALAMVSASRRGRAAPGSPDPRA